MVMLALLVPLVSVSLWTQTGAHTVTATPNATGATLQTEESVKRSTFTTYSTEYDPNEIEEVTLLKAGWHIPEQIIDADPKALNMQELLSQTEFDEDSEPGESFKAKLYDEQTYECVLLPKKPENYESYEHIDDHDDSIHEQVHHLYDLERAEPKAPNHKPKLRDFGNFLFVDDSKTPRPSYSMPTNKKTVSSSKKKKSRKEMDDLFIKLKSSLDKLMCYQNDECYGGSLDSDNDKADQFIRHIRMSKKVFDMLEKNRNHLMLMQQELPEEGAHKSEGTDHRHQLVVGKPVSLSPMLYSDSNHEPVAVKVTKRPLPIKYYGTSRAQPSAEEIALKRRRHPIRHTSTTASTSLIDSLSKNSNKLASKLGKHLISSLLGTGSLSANFFLNRDSAPAIPRQNQWPHHPNHPLASASTSPSLLPISRIDWPKPVLVIKEYEEYNE